MPACLITGAARRIGAGITETLARAGWTVVVHYGGSEEAATALAARLNDEGAKVLPIHADLNVQEDVEGLVPAAAELAGEPLSLLINNASSFVEDHMGTLKSDIWDDHAQVNLKAPTFLAQAFAGQVSEDQRGLIINMLDQKLWNPNPDFFSYTISKFGLNGATEMMARSLAPKIRVCGIAPGIVLPSSYQSQEHFEKIHDKNPLQHGVTLEDITRTVMFLINSPGISGQTILVDGGQHFGNDARDVLYAEFKDED